MKKMTKFDGISIYPAKKEYWCCNCDVRDGTITVKLNCFQSFHLCPRCFKSLQTAMGQVDANSF